MRFVLGNRLLDRAGGTEVHLVTVGEQLLRLGHDVCLYSPKLGSFSEAAGRRGLRAVASLDELPASCDVVLAQDTIVSYDLAERYPDALAVYRVCGDVFDFQLPPQLQGVVDLIVVVSDRYERLVRGCEVQAPVARLRVPIDLDRLVPLSRIAERPRRAALLGNYPERTEVIAEACRRHGIETLRVGGASQSYDVATALADVDIVFAKSRAALDAMACGRAVYIFDLFGGDGWVTAQSYGALEADNFAGLATDRIITLEELDRDLDAYDPAMGGVNRDLIVQHHNPRDHTLAMLEAISVSSAATRPQAPLRELARLSALNWSWEQVAAERRSAQAAMHDRIVSTEHRMAETLAVAAAAQTAHEADEVRLRELRSQLEQARNGDDPVALHAQIDAMRGTRVWRTASRYWQLKSRLARAVSRNAE